MTLFIMFIFIVLLCLAVPIGLSVGITSLLPSLLTDSFTAGGVFITRSMLGGVNQTTLLAIPLFVLSGIIMARAGSPRSCSMFFPISLVKRLPESPVRPF